MNDFPHTTKKLEGEEFNVVSHDLLFLSSEVLFLACKTRL